MSFPHQHHYPLPHDHMGSGRAAVCGRSGHALLPVHLRVRRFLFVHLSRAPFCSQDDSVSAMLGANFVILLYFRAAVSKVCSTLSRTTSPRTRRCCSSWWPTRSSSIGPCVQVSPSPSALSVRGGCCLTPAHVSTSLVLQSSDIFAKRTTGNLHGK